MKSVTAVLVKKGRFAASLRQPNWLNCKWLHNTLVLIRKFDGTFNMVCFLYVKGRLNYLTSKVVHSRLMEVMGESTTAIFGRDYQ